uniref:Ribosome biogenesis protein WDR12 homolog n=1 Tax=Lygus hesperus TaxID=30085 RepID=A0A146M840_LYGHE
MADNQSDQLQIRFVTKQDRYSVPDNPFAVPSSVTAKELNDLVNQLFHEGNAAAKKVEFDFIAAGELLRTHLGDHLNKRGISLESVVEIEYLERHPPPEALDCLIHDDWVSSVDVSDFAIVTGCYDTSVHLWTTQGVHKLSVPAHTSPIKAVAWLKTDGPIASFVSASQDQTCMIWEWDVDENTVRCTDVCKGHIRSVDSVAVAPDGNRFASGSWDKMLKIWSLIDDDGESEHKKARKSGISQTKTPQVTLKGHKECISGMCWIDNVELATCSWDHTVRIWDTEMNSSVREIGGNKSFFNVQFSKTNNLLATCSADRHIRLYDPRSTEGQIVKVTLTSHKNWVSSVSWSSDKENLLVSGSYDNAVKLWDIRSPQVPLYDLNGHDDKVMCTNWSHSPLIVSGGADNTLRIFKSSF